MAEFNLTTDSDLHVIIAGHPRSGKSTGLNNIFNLDLRAQLSSTPITANVTSVTTTQNGIKMTVTDTPGLGVPNPTKNRIVIRDIKNVGIEHSFLLIITLVVSSGSCITESYRNILKNLTMIFGKKIWNWSLVLLTSSDKLCDLSSAQGYMRLLRDHCMELQNVLEGIGVKTPVKLFSDYTSKDSFRSKTLSGIVAIPVGQVPEFPTERLFPLQPWTHDYKWTELAFIEIAKLAKDIPNATMQREALIRLRFGRYMVDDKLQAIVKVGAGGAAGGAVGGGAIGAGIGAGVGVLGGPVGIGIGVAVGGVIGLVAGGIAGGIGAGGIAAAVIRIDRMIEMEREELR